MEKTRVEVTQESHRGAVFFLDDDDLEVCKVKAKAGSRSLMSALHRPGNAQTQGKPLSSRLNMSGVCGLVHVKSQFILNGVCVVWKGWIDLIRLDGIGRLDFDEERAEAEDALLREQIEEYNRRLRDFEERQRQYRQEQERQAQAEAEGPSHPHSPPPSPPPPQPSPGEGHHSHHAD